MITMEQFLENNTEQEGICIAVYGKEQYDDFMNILENNNYGWGGSLSATNFYATRIGEDTTFILLVYLNKENKRITHITFRLENEPDYDDIDFVFCEEESSSNYLIKPFPYLKREMRDLGLCCR